MAEDLGLAARTTSDAACLSFIHPYASADSARDIVAEGSIWTLKHHLPSCKV